MMLSPSKRDLAWDVVGQGKEREGEREAEVDASPSAVKAPKVPKSPEVTHA
jgi:hypothetical protein